MPNNPEFYVSLNTNPTSLPLFGRLMTSGLIRPAEHHWGVWTGGRIEMGKRTTQQDRQCTWNVTMRRIHESLLQWKSSKYYLLVCMCKCACAYVHVASLFQHATRMRHIVTSLVAHQSPLSFSTLSHKRYDFRKKVIEHKMCVLIICTILSKTFLILRRIQRDVIKVKTSSCKISIILVGFRSWQSFEKTQISDFIKMRPVGAELFHADGQTDMTKLIVAFRNIANAPKNCRGS
jgi:hypothetical protein